MIKLLSLHGRQPAPLTVYSIANDAGDVLEIHAAANHSVAQEFGQTVTLAPACRRWLLTPCRTPLPISFEENLMSFVLLLANASSVWAMAANWILCCGSPFSCTCIDYQILCKFLNYKGQNT